MASALVFKNTTQSGNYIHGKPTEWPYHEIFDDRHVPAYRSQRERSSEHLIEAGLGGPPACRAARPTPPTRSCPTGLLLMQRLYEHALAIEVQITPRGMRALGNFYKPISRKAGGPRGVEMGGRQERGRRANAHQAGMTCFSPCHLVYGRWYNFLAALRASTRHGHFNSARSYEAAGR